MLNLEIIILKNLKYELLTTSSYQFLTIIAQNLKDDSDKELTLNLALYILDLTLLEYKMLKFPSSVKACASIYIARKLLKYKDAWNHEIKNVFSFCDGVIRGCSTEITDLINLANKSSFKNCKKKYSSIEFLNVSKILEDFK